MKKRFQYNRSFRCGRCVLLSFLVGLLLCGVERLKEIWMFCLYLEWMCLDNLVLYVFYAFFQSYLLSACLYMWSHSFNTSTLLPLRLLCAMEMCKLCIYTAVSRLCNRQVFVTSAQINFDLNVRPD